MSILDFRASYVEYLDGSTEGYYDKRGEWHDGDERWCFLAKCNVMQAGQESKISIPDGSVEHYTYTIGGLPRDCRKFKYGERIRIHVFGDEEYDERTVKGFQRYQFQSKIYC